MALSEVMAGITLQAATPDLMLAGLTHDSRAVSSGYAFVALPGTKAQGSDFIPQAIANGAGVIVGPRENAADSPIPYLGVDDPRAAYSRMAANYYGHPSHRLTTVGITGTNGKTTTAEILAAIMTAGGLITATLGTLGAHWGNTTRATGYTTPDPVTLHRLLAEMLADGQQGAVLEVSSHALDQRRSDDVAFNLAIFTNLTPEHLDYHADMAAYLAAKLRLFTRLPSDGIAIINGDDPAAKKFIAAAPGTTLTYGLGSESDLRVENMGLSLERTVANLSYGDRGFSIESRLIGSHNLMNILAATLAALALDLPVEAIQRGITEVTAVPGRLERIAAPVPGAVMIDYAHTPDAYEQVLGTIRDLAPAGTRLALLFGCGGDRDRTKRPVMATIAEHYADAIYITSDNPRTEPLEQINAEIVAGFSATKHVVIPDRTAALQAALSAMTTDTLLLILGKGREVYEIIGTEKIPHDDIAIIEAFEA